jgi:hypothetical protein
MQFSKTWTRIHILCILVSQIGFTLLASMPPLQIAPGAETNSLGSLVGIGGVVASDRVLGLKRGEILRSRFVKALEEEFTEPDGSILPIRSELTGFTVRCGLQYLVND